MAFTDHSFCPKQESKDRELRELRQQRDRFLIVHLILASNAFARLDDIL